MLLYIQEEIEMKQKTKQSRNVMYEMEAAITALFVILMLGFFPLFFQDSYFNIAEAKMMFFYFCGAGLTVLTLILAGTGYLQERKASKARQKTAGHAKANLQEILKQIPIDSWFAIGLAVTLVIATVCSVNPSESFYGTDGRHLGLIMFALCIAAYVILGKYLRPGIWMAWIFLASGSLVSLILILQFWGVNVFHMWDEMMPNQVGMFASTIGNVNACGTYFCMILPVGMVLYYLSDGLLSRVLYGIFLTLGFYGAYATNTDGWILGLGVSFLVMLWFSLKNHDYARRFLEVCLMFWGASLVLKLTLIAGAGKTDAFMKQLFLGLKIQNFMISGKVLLAEGILLGFLLILVIGAEKKKWEVPYRKIRNVFFILVAVAFGFAVGAVLAANLSGEKQWEGALQWMNRLKLQDNFGSGRGVIWKQTWTAWKKLPAGRKIFGYGLNTFHLFLYEYQGAELANYGGRIVDPHNELLQFLSITGIFGAVSYFGLLISSAVSAGRMSRNYPVLMMGTVMLCSYMAQSMVNNPTAFLTPTLFLYLGILKSLKRHYKEKEAEG